MLCKKINRINCLLEYKISNKKVYEFDSVATIMQLTNSIRPAQPADLERLVIIEKKCFPLHQAYSKKQLHYLITKAKSLTLVECEDDELRGFIICLTRQGSNKAGVETLNVDPSYRGKGIALKLLQSIEKCLALEGIDAMQLEVSIGNSAAIRLYEKVGYHTISQLPNYYQNHYFGSRDALRMIKPLIA